jgi:hypothetical protein
MFIFTQLCTQKTFNKINQVTNKSIAMHKTVKTYALVGRKKKSSIQIRQTRRQWR